jgi:hypothetical protein
MEILSEHNRLCAEERLALLICSNHGFAGGSGAKELADKFSAQISA